jgi:hypothetical protein
MPMSRRHAGRGHASARPLVGALAAAMLLAGMPHAAAAQGPTVTNPPRTQELGIDAGAVIGLGDQSSVSIALPAARARVGFFMTNAARWSLEPAVGLNYIKVEGGDGALFYNLEAGALYHFRPGGDLSGATRATAAYLRPFLGVSGVTGDGGDSEVSAGAGLGVKIPWRAGLAWRLEGNLGYGFDNEAFRLGAFAGISVFTRRGS